MRNQIKIQSICDGESFSIAEVKDVVFASKIMGDGIAYTLKNNIIYSPCDGEIILFPETKHAIGIQVNSSIQLLIHIGIDTIYLNGEGFKELFENKKIKRGQPLLEIDLHLMQSKNIDMTTILILVNPTENKIKNKNYGVITHNDTIMTII